MPPNRQFFISKTTFGVLLCKNFTSVTPTIYRRQTTFIIEAISQKSTICEKNKKNPKNVKNGEFWKGNIYRFDGKHIYLPEQLRSKTTVYMLKTFLDKSNWITSINMNPIEQFAKPKLCVIALLYIVLYVSPWEYEMTSIILFYPIYWYSLKIELNLFQFLFLFSGYWFWDFKNSRAAAKKGPIRPFFLIFSRGCFSGVKPPRQPQFCAVWTWSSEQKTFKTWLFEQKQKQKRTWFLNLLGRLKFWLIMIKEQNAWLCSYFK